MQEKISRKLYLLKELELDASELQELKGISIGVTAENQPFLVLNYEGKNMADKASPWVLGVIVVVLALLYWWLAR